MTIKDITEIDEISETTIRKYIKEGKLKATKNGGKYWIDIEDYKKFMVDSLKWELVYQRPNKKSK